MTVATFARFAIPLILGIAIGARIRDEMEEDEPQVTEPVLKESELARRIRSEGIRIIQSDKIPNAETNIGKYIESYYRGLYFIGRTGAKLKDETLESVALRLQHLHHQHKPKRDKKLVAWYETIGVSNPDSLAELLAENPLAQRFDTRYIAHAMGEAQDGLTFDGLLEEATEHFRQ